MRRWLWVLPEVIQGAIGVWLLLWVRHHKYHDVQAGWASIIGVLLVVLSITLGLAAMNTKAGGRITAVIISVPLSVLGLLAMSLAIQATG